jgi:hypothetical protein
MIIRNIFRCARLATCAFSLGIALCLGVGSTIADDKDDKATDAEEEKLFTKWDTDKNGKVSAFEFVRVHRAAVKRGETLDMEALKKKFVALDVNEDQNLSEIEVHPPKPVAAPCSKKGTAPKKGSAPKKPADT